MVSGGGLIVEGIEGVEEEWLCWGRSEARCIHKIRNERADDQKSIEVR